LIIDLMRGLCSNTSNTSLSSDQLSNHIY
jgi:hypothetical protein